MARRTRGNDENGDPFLRSKIQYEYNLDLFEQKYRKLQERELQSGVEIDLITDDIYVPNNFSERAVQAKCNQLERSGQEFGFGKLSTTCNSLEVFGKGHTKRAKECQQLHADFKAKFERRYPKWQPYNPPSRPKVKRTIRETVKELVFEEPLDYLYYIMKIKGFPLHVFDQQGAVSLPMVVGDCSKSRECSPVLHNLPVAGAHDLPKLMVSDKDCSRSRECSPVRTVTTAKEACTLANFAITDRDCSRSRECSPECNRKATVEASHSESVPSCGDDRGRGTGIRYCVDVINKIVQKDTSKPKVGPDSTSGTTLQMADESSSLASTDSSKATSVPPAPIQFDSSSQAAAPHRITRSAVRQASNTKGAVVHQTPATSGTKKGSFRQQKCTPQSNNCIAAKPSALHEVTPTSSKTPRRVATQEKSTTGKRKKTASTPRTPTNLACSTGGEKVARSETNPAKQVSPSLKTSRVAVTHATREASAQKSVKKAMMAKSSTLHNVTPPSSKTSRRTSHNWKESTTGKRKRAASTPVTPENFASSTPSTDGKRARRSETENAGKKFSSQKTSNAGVTRAASALKTVQNVMMAKPSTSHKFTPVSSRTPRSGASQKQSGIGNRKRAVSTPAAPENLACSTPRTDGERVRRCETDVVGKKSSSPKTSNTGVTHAACEAPAQKTGKKAQRPEGSRKKSNRSHLASPSLNNSLSPQMVTPVVNHRPTSVSPEITIGRSSLRSRIRAVSKAPLSSAKASSAKSSRVASTCEADRTKTTRSVKGIERKMSSRSAPTPVARAVAGSSKGSRHPRTKSSKNAPSKISTQLVVLTPKDGSSPSPTTSTGIQDRSYLSTMATASSTTRRARSNESDISDEKSFSAEAPSGLWDESVQTVFDSYEESFPVSSKKMTILGFDAQEFRKHCGDSSQTTLSSFVSCARKYREISGESYLDNGLKEDRRAMASAKSRNRALKNGYFA